MREKPDRNSWQVVRRKYRVCGMCSCAWLLGFGRCLDTTVVNAVRRVSKPMISRVH